MAKKILVVDDDDLVLIAIQELLTPLGFSVTTSRTARRPWRKLPAIALIWSSWM